MQACANVWHGTQQRTSIMNASPRRTRLELRLERLEVTRRGTPWWGLKRGRECERVCATNNDNSYPHSLNVGDGAVEFPHIPLKVQRVGFAPRQDGVAPELRLVDNKKVLCVCEMGL